MFPRRVEFNVGNGMKTYTKKDFPVAKVRRFLEPGPIVLVSSAHQSERNIMTLGWHMINQKMLVAEAYAPTAPAPRAARRVKAKA